MKLARGNEKILALVACIFLSGQLGGQRKATQSVSKKSTDVAWATSTNKPSKPQASGGDFVVQFKQALKDSKDVLMQIKSFTGSFGSFLQQENYFDSSKINAVKQDPKMQNKKIGLIVNFGYSGAGPVDLGFQGVMITPVLETLPATFKLLFQKALELSCQQLFNGNFVQDPVAKTKVLRSSPLTEFFFKMVLLVNGKSQKTIDKNSFNAQLFILVNRLSLTPGFTSADDIVRSLPAVLKSILSIVKIQKKSLQDFLKGYLLIFNEIKNYNFASSDTTTLQKKDMSKFIKILCAISLRALIDYSKAKSVFLKTPEGQAFYQQNKQLSEAKQEALLAQQLPEYPDIKSQMQERVTALIKRLSFYKKIQSALKAKLSPLLDPLLGQFGFSLDVLLPDDTTTTAADQMSSDQVDQMLTNDPLFGDVATDVQEVALPEDASLPADEDQSIAADQQDAELEPNLLDLFDDIMDKIDKLDAADQSDSAAEKDLQKQLMNTMQQSLEEFDTFQVTDLTDLAYILLDAQSYVDSQDDVKTLQSFFLKTKKVLASKGIGIQE